MYKVRDNILLAALITEIQNALKDEERLFVGSTFGDVGRSDKQILVSLQDSTLERFTASDFYGVLHSNVSLAKYPANISNPETAIAWVANDQRSDVIVPPGYYFVEIELDAEGKPQAYVTPYVLVEHEYSVQLGVDYQLPSDFDDMVPESFRLVDLTLGDVPRPLIKDTHYTLTSLNPGYSVNVHAEYLYDGAPLYATAMKWLTRTGPYPVEPNQVDTTILPGVEIYFSDQVFHPDRQLIVVEKGPIPLADVYAVRWRSNVSVDVFAASRIECNNLADRVKEFVVNDLHRVYGMMGIEVADLNVSKAEEPRYDTPSEYSFQTTITFSVLLTWLWADTYLTPLESVSIIQRAPDNLSDVEAAGQEQSRFIWTTKLSEPIVESQLEWIR